MRLLKSLSGSGVAFFLVGDDWQSIYRFAGSDVGLMRNCEAHLGHVQERPLSRTWRFGAGVLEPSSSFVQRNPEQTRRALEPADVPQDHGVTVVSAANPSDGLLTSLNDLEALVDGRPTTVLMLGRYRRTGDLLPALATDSPLSVTFSTVHSAKGQEADYVIVLDLKNQRTGFPSKIEDDPLMDLVLPPVSGESYPHAEERRLFYVALTRARYGAYLVTDTGAPSEFVAELQDESPNLRRLGEPQPPTCPLCSAGRLVASQTGRSLVCTGRLCANQVPSCSSCNAGHTVVRNGRAECTNANCLNPPGACPSCRGGVLVVRQGPRGPFLGCTMYWIAKPPCTFTGEASEGRSGR